MIRVILKTFEQYEKHYEIIKNIEKEKNLKNKIEGYLSSVFLISQNIPKRDVADFFSDEDFSLNECYEELEVSYELMKLGFYKQSMISLRTSLDIGLMSIYWTNKGFENNDFKEWLKSKKNTPFKGKDFWKIILQNEYIKEFNEKFDLINDIKNIDLSDYVHTKGKSYSNLISHRKVLVDNLEEIEFKRWIDIFKRIIRFIEILHLLRYPTLTIRYGSDYLIKKFGTIKKIPIFGAGYGDEMNIIPTAIHDNEYEYILKIIKDDEEIKDIRKWIEELPNLTEENIRRKIIEEQKNEILHCGGYNNWYKSYQFYDSRIDDKILNELKIWALEENIIEYDYENINRLVNKRE